MCLSARPPAISSAIDGRFLAYFSRHSSQDRERERERERARERKKNRERVRDIENGRGRGGGGGEGEGLLETLPTRRGSSGGTLGNKSDVSPHA